MKVMDNVTKNKLYLYVFAILTVTFFAVVAYLLSLIILPKSGVLLLLLLAVVIVSISSNKMVTTLAGILCVLIFNYFFTTPLYSFHMINGEDIINSIFFILVAVSTSEFSIRYRNKSAELKQAEMRSNILLSVSHDLRTPLAGIIGSLSTYKEYKPQISLHDQQLLINSALAESHRLHDYVENLLQLTRLENEDNHLVFQHQSIWPVILRVEARFADKRLIVSKGNTLKTVSIQESLIEQAIYNIVDNALKYSPKQNKVFLDVSCDDLRVYVRVKDSGAGIPKEKHSHIFDLFYSSRIGDSGQGGSGIGLTVVKGIVDVHQGKVSVIDSEQGCIIELVLPCDDFNEKN
ncbi:hypothetical protein LCGC14_0505210 [marine sediment metagenome]|uniref:Histidine kinase domain-containing protein n=1 Tax=marine sediment metagenome TaxID=412755 RepID=A0A0F9SL76_9ZZZZ|nr:PAS domain-containing sensor histidine kinase [Methylophaga sp.]HEC59243.1 PAS domain-containing sensor histidine kinase [Methylophaga sp.]